VTRATRRLLPLVAVCLLLPQTARTQTSASSDAAGKMVDVDPIRCWWKTNTGAVRIGQVFTVSLTCAVLQNDAVQVVPDESRLGASVITMAPFEMVKGTHPADLYSGDRRFFQYEYDLRLINPDEVGKDVRVPDQLIHYHVNSRIAANAALQGRDHVYDLPPLEVRILSMVPADATDIRDTGKESFGISESLGFRANVLEIIAIAAFVLGALFIVLSIVRLILRTRKQKSPTGERGLGEPEILRHVTRELAAVRSESEAQGWNDTLVGRALAAARITAAAAVGRPIGQNRRASARAAEGGLQMNGWRRKPAILSGGATTTHVTNALNRLSDVAPAAERTMLEDLQASLSAFTHTQYARTAAFDRSTLDDAIARASAAAAHLKAERAWPKVQLKRWTKWADFGR